MARSEVTAFGASALRVRVSDGGCWEEPVLTCAGAQVFLLSGGAQRGGVG